MPIMSSNMYALEGYKRVYKRRKGYVDISTAYPEGVPRSMGRLGGSGVLMARIARGGASGYSPGEVAYAIEQNDPRNTPVGHNIGVSSHRFPVIIPAEVTLGAASRTIGSKTAASVTARTASSGIAAGGTALARGGPAVGTTPGGGLSLAGVGSSVSGITSNLSNVGSGIINTVTKFLPLAIQIIVAVVVIKIVIAIVRGRRR